MTQINNISESVKSDMEYRNAVVGDVEIGYNMTYDYICLTQTDESEDMVIIQKEDVKDVIAILTEMVGAYPPSFTTTKKPGEHHDTRKQSNNSYR